MHRNQPHIPPAGGAAVPMVDFKPAKRRGSYSCSRCGQPKKGHSCNASGGVSSAGTPGPATTLDSTSSSVSRPCSNTPQSRQISNFRRALSFDDVDVRCDSPDLAADHSDYQVSPPDLDADEVLRSGGLPAVCVWEILKRLPPVGLLAAAGVCKGWRDTSRSLWRAAEELRLKVPRRAQLGFVGSVLQKCSALVRLSLRMESDVDSTMLACVAFSCPNLEFLEICISEGAVNRITGDELGRFVADKRCLMSLKMEGCSNLGGFVLSSTSLSTIWLSDLHSVSKMVFNCPNLKEISLEFSRHESDSTDLTTMVDGLGRSCPRLQNIHIASMRLSHAVVLALAAANLRCLRMLSLVLGSEITDASVAAIVSSYSKLELLDLSGSSVSDNGIHIICNVFPTTLSRLLLALCPNITSNGIQFATTQLPYLELMDCGMTLSDPNPQNPITDEDGCSEVQNTFNDKLHLMYQKLIIKHSRLKKLSLWGCSGLDALYLHCPELNDLNLNSCKNLHPDRLLLQCPRLESVHASGCQEFMIETIKNQVCNQSAPSENLLPCKRLADGSKRIRVPYLISQQSTEDERKQKMAKVARRICNVMVI